MHHGLALVALAVITESSSLQCGTHGIFYREDVMLGLPQSCECFQCYEGPDCSTLTANCTADVTTVELSLAREWFVAREEAVRADFGASYHMPYLDQPSYLHPGAPVKDRISSALNRTIRELHGSVGNVPGGQELYQLVIGAGAMQILSAATYALSAKSGPSACSMTSQAPYWGEFLDIAEAQRIAWKPGANEPATNDNDCVIEVITSPNNPDGRPMSSVVNTSRRIYDYVYHWPPFLKTNHSDEKLQSELPAVVVFSLSKLSGYAASRVGWAFVREKSIAGLMDHYIFVNGQGAGVEAQYRATRILRAIHASLASDASAIAPSSFFDFMHQRMARRWAELRGALQGQNLFTIDGEADQPFAWIRCPKDLQLEGAPASCSSVFATQGLRVSPGSGFGVDDVRDPHVRIIMGQDDSTFALMMQRVKLAVHGSHTGALAAPITRTPTTTSRHLQHGRVSVHQHIVPPAYVSTCIAHNVSLGADVPSLIWDAEKTQAAMSKRGVAAAVLSLSYPGVYFPHLPISDEAKRDLAAVLAQQSNDFLASDTVVGRFRPNPFGGFATLPLPSVPEALTELRRALDPPGYHGHPLDGVVLYSNYGGIYLGDRSFDPVFEELNRRDAIVFIHPVSPLWTPTPLIPFWLLDFVFDTTRTLVSMVQNRTFLRYPRIKFIAAHAGGTLPFLLDRIQELRGDPRYNVSADPEQQLKSLYFDTTNVESGGAYALDTVRAFANASRVVYGDDYPMMTERNLESEAEGLTRYFHRAGFNEAERAAVEYYNALALFRQLAPAVSSGAVKQRSIMFV